MQKYYLSKVIGVGSSHDSYRVAAADVIAGIEGADLMTFLPIDPVNGKPTRSEVLCVVEAPGSIHAQLAGDAANHYQLPDTGLLKIKLASLASAAKNGMNARAAAANFDVNFVADSYGDWVTGIGKQCEPAFDVNTFTVS